MDSRHKNIKDIERCPEIAVGALIKNKDEKYLLIRSSHWHDKLTIVGGHVEYGETLVEAIHREVKEEIGVEIDHLELIGPYELMDDPEYYQSGHVVSFRYLARIDKKHDEIVLDHVEAEEYFWLSADEILSRDDVAHTAKSLIKDIMEKNSNRDKKSIFSRKCADCEKVKTELETYRTGWQRALADYKNLQREISERRAEWVQMSEVQILDEFIPVYDNFKKAFSVNFTDWSPEQKNWLKGIEYIMKQFGDVLKSHQIEEIKTVGEKFDPTLHEASGEEESETESGMILREVSAGYRIGQKVIKAARVVVAK